MKKIILSLAIVLAVSIVSSGAYAAVRCGSCNEKCTHDKSKKCEKSCEKGKKACSSSTSKTNCSKVDAKSCTYKDAKNTSKVAPKIETTDSKPTEKKTQ